MKILIDIGHPAHVHYFKNFMRIMKEKGHEFLVTARDKEITFDLLDKYRIPYHNRGKGGSSLTGKLLYILKADLFIWKKARRFKPDLFMSFASTYAAHASWLSRRPHIALDDTEHAKLELMLYPPFTEVILTPDCFSKDLGKKHIRLKSYIEFSYLHRDYFKPDLSIRQEMGLGPDERFVLFRYISWGAAHDRGHSGIPDEMKTELITLFTSRGYKIFISAEGKLNAAFEPYRISIAPERIHFAIDQADFFIGESGTMSTEACLLGTPAVFVNSLDAGVFQDEANRKLLYSFRSPEGVVECITGLLDDSSLTEKHQSRADQLHNEKMNVTAFLVWFVENYPASFKQVKENPESVPHFLPKQLSELTA